MKLFFFCISLLVSTSLLAQKEANHWVIGEFVGLDFNPGEPVVFSGQANTQFSTVSISDKNSGELLFYSDGLTIWNRDHEVMLNGNDINGSAPRFFQHCIAVPLPSDPSRYYLFTLAASTGEQLYHRLFYSVIDMSLDDGRGGVVEPLKNVNADMTLLAAKIMAIPHANDKDYWLVTHSVTGNDFYVSLVNDNGILPPDTIRLGSFYETRPVDVETTGYIKASPNGKKIAVSHLFSRDAGVNTGDPIEDGWPFELFDFDPAIGEITSPVYLGHFIRQAGISFSPGNSKLYLLGIDNEDFFHQFDLNSEDILASKTGLFEQNPRIRGTVIGVISEAMEIAINGKVYLGGGSYPFPENNALGVIHNPNAKGVDCDFQRVTFPLGPFQRFSFGLPNSIQSTFDNITSNRNPNVPCNDNTLYVLYPNPASDVMTLEVPERCFGPYKLSIYSSLGQRICRHAVDRQVFGPIDVKNFKSGLYFAVLEFADARIVKQFVKL
ncbi:MAG: T9SS type A sorting domain-containing protein [Cytophagales bacterium]|nr:T9SS type A sorting domain-containing protein [Cytophagales bacterium]